jgi:succinoglycan biosynthesis protein ExoU
MLGPPAEHVAVSDVCPEIAVVVAAWNAESTILRAIRSALDQVGPAVEVIAVDDASTDRTLEILKGIAASEPRLRVLRQATNGGPAGARNRALDVASAPWVTILDADDTMAHDRLSRLLALAEAGPWDVVADDLWKVWDHDHGSARRRLWCEDRIGVEPLGFAGFVAGNLSGRTDHRGELGFLKPLIRRDFLDRNGIRYREGMRLGEDFALYGALLACGARACLTDPCGYVALVRSESLSGHHAASDLQGLVEANRWLSGLPGLGPVDRAVLRAHNRETQERWRWLRLIEAVKRRDLRDALECFATTPPVALSLLRRLVEQARLRTGRRLRELTGHDPAPTDPGA